MSWRAIGWNERRGVRRGRVGVGARGVFIWVLRFGVGELLVDERV